MLQVGFYHDNNSKIDELVKSLNNLSFRVKREIFTL